MPPNQADSSAQSFASDVSPWLKKWGGTISTGIGAAGDIVGGNAQASALRANAQTYTNEGLTASMQATQAEATQRRQGAQVIGSMTAAAGQAGAGYQGSNGRMIAQSASNAELDALNIRYKGQLQKWAYFTQASNLRGQASAAQDSGILKAGATLLKGFSGNYTGTGKGSDFSGLGVG